MKKDWLLYGANGYTGKLIAQRAKQLGLTPVLGGRNREAVVKTPCLGVTASDNWDKTPDWAAFAQLMRRATTVGLDLDKGASALADWPDADFQSLDKTGRATPENLAKLAKADDKLGEAKTAWDVYIKDLTAKFRHERELREAGGSTAQPKAAPAKAAL